MVPSARSSSLASFCQSAMGETPGRGPAAARRRPRGGAALLRHALLVQRVELGTDAVREQLEFAEQFLLVVIDLVVGEDVLAQPGDLADADLAVGEDGGADGLVDEGAEGGHSLVGAA